MPPKKYKAPPNVDYDPVTGAFPNISFGVVEAVDVGGRPRRLEDVVVKRLSRPRGQNPLSLGRSRRRTARRYCCLEERRITLLTLSSFARPSMGNQAIKSSISLRSSRSASPRWMKYHNGCACMRLSS